MLALVRIGVMLGALGHPSLARAQPHRQSLCVPGTTVCASSDGHGGVQVTGTGNAAVTPNGATAAGQAQGAGNANANANANGNANANANANANGNANANANGGGAANGEGSRTGGGQTNVSPPPPQYAGDSSSYGGYRGRYGFGLGLCPLVRVGVWSGFKAGGCFTISFRFEGFIFEMETQLLYGGTTHAFDWTFPLSFVIPLGAQESLFEGGYLRFGGSPVGATFAHAKDGGNFVRFGLFAGAGYELELSRAFTWRVIDARLAFDMGTKRAMDRKGHWVDLGLQVGTGIIF